ncbi:MFS transporter [Nocardioides sp.]|uniref:MFS transporter n=1 Tax=Nocardioides sp. TaxID=35761 RepID=UPI0019AB0A19|nr:MFS transporter [Nocardioides sp.]MBC7274973.1 MFS transporter [Nocardioides sp.]
MSTDIAAEAPAVAPLRGSVVWFMALAAALGTSTIYPLQPAIADVAHSFDSSITAVGMALAFGPVGYMSGLGLLVPLVDRWSPRRVLGIQFGVLSLALALTAVISNLLVLGLLIGVAGACSVVGAGLSSVAGRLAPTHRRGTVLGIVTAGISVGILAGRIVGGWLAEEIGWRNMVLVFAAACAIVAVCSVLALPAVRGTSTRGYLATLRSLPGLLLRDTVLRLAGARGALWFFAFCAVWAGLAVALSEPPYAYSAAQIGLFALAGLSGILAAQAAGAWTDRVGARRVILVGLTVAGASATALTFALSSTIATLACLALFDAGLFAAQVANQSTVLAIDPAAPARYNSTYMLVYFVGGSLGTAFGSAAVELVGWSATVVVTAAAIAVAALITLSTGGASAGAGDELTQQKGQAGV